MRIAIVEDETGPRDSILRYLEQFQKENSYFSYESESFPSGESFLVAEASDSFDLVFLDIELEGMNGFEMAKKLRETDKNINIIFVTNLSQYAINGYEVDAMDFCLKPLSYPDFVMKMNKAIRRFTRDGDAKIIKTDIYGRTAIIQAKNILYVEIVKHYLTYHLSNGTDVVVRGSMKEASQELSLPGFYRTNSCYIVNMKHIEYITKDDVVIRGNHNPLPISRARKSEFLDAFACYIGALK